MPLLIQKSIIYIYCFKARVAAAQDQSSSMCGVGGGAGAMQIACINLDESWEIYCGQGGVGAGGSSNGTNGEDTAIYLYFQFINSKRR